MNQVFISFVSEDADVAVPIAGGLEQAGLTTWYYTRDNSQPGPQYLAVIAEAIQRCQAMVVVLSRETERSPQVLSEIVQAFEQGKKLIPVLRGMTHIEFQSINPVWRGAFGAATSIELPASGPDAILPRLLGGLLRLGVTPYFDGRHTPPTPSTVRLVPPSPVPPLTTPLTISPLTISPSRPKMPTVSLRTRFDHDAYPPGEDSLAYILAELKVTADGDRADDGPGVDLALVLDVSGSMDAPNRYPLLRSAVRRLVAGLGPRDRVSITLFTDRAATVVPFRPGDEAVADPDAMVRAMDESGLLFGTSTLLAPGLRLALEGFGGGMSERVRRTYVLTDGELHDSPECVAALAGYRPRRSEVHVYGFGTGFDAVSLKRLVSDQMGGTVKPIIDEQDIVKTFAHVAEVNRRLIGRNGKLTVTLATDVVAGDAWVYQPHSRYLGPVSGHKVEYEIGGVESGRTYSVLVEVRLPTKSDAVGVVEAEWMVESEQVMHQFAMTSQRGRAGKPVADIQRAFEISHALRVAGDKAAELAACKARRELAELEGRDPQLLAALDKQIRLLDKEVQDEDDFELELDSDPELTVMDKLHLAADWQSEEFLLPKLKEVEITGFSDQEDIFKVASDQPKKPPTDSRRG